MRETKLLLDAHPIWEWKTQETWQSHLTQVLDILNQVSNIVSNWRGKFRFISLTKSAKWFIRSKAFDRWKPAARRSARLPGMIWTVRRTARGRPPMALWRGKRPERPCRRRQAPAANTSSSWSCLCPAAVPPPSERYLYQQEHLLMLTRSCMICGSLQAND